MFAIRLILRPTSPLTFRRVPFATTEILTYPFAPPTALGGYLDRLLRLARGEDIPAIYNEEESHFYTLPQSYHVLGALPDAGVTIIRTKRQGIRSIDHMAFSRLQRNNDKQVYQLYSWEYLLTEQLVGYVVHEQEKALVPLKAVQNFGSKFGKEGWAFVEAVEGPFAVEPKRMKAKPSCLVPATDAFGAASSLYPLFRYGWSEESSSHELCGGPAPIAGFVPLLLAIMHAPVEMDFYVGHGVCIPTALLEFF